MNSQLKEDNLRMLKEITKINEDFLKVTEKNYWEVEPADRQNWKIKKLEENIVGLENQVKAKTGELEKCNRILTDMKKKSSDEGYFKKEIEKQAEEINCLNEGLSKITQFVFSLVSPDPEDTCVVESTLKAIKKIYADSQRDNKGKVLKRQESGNIKVNIPMSSASEKSLRVQSPGLRQKKFK
jgi:capsid portal protein